VRGHHIEHAFRELWCDYSGGGWGTVEIGWDVYRRGDLQGRYTRLGVPLLGVSVVVFEDARELGVGSWTGAFAF
jgi:hypothetical protein